MPRRMRAKICSRSPGSGTWSSPCAPPSRRKRTACGSRVARASATASLRAACRSSSDAKTVPRGRIGARLSLRASATTSTALRLREVARVRPKVVAGRASGARWVVARWAVSGSADVAGSSTSGGGGSGARACAPRRLVLDSKCSRRGWWGALPNPEVGLLAPAGGWGPEAALLDRWIGGGLFLLGGYIGPEAALPNPGVGCVLVLV